MWSAGLGVGKLGEGAGGEVGGLKSAGLHPKKIGPERRVGVLILGNGRDGGYDGEMRTGGPIAIVGAQGFAISVADERGAIGDLGGAALRRSAERRVGQEG